MKIAEQILESEKRRSQSNEKLNEAADIKKIINTLISTKWSGSNEQQMKAVQLLKGVATSDEPAANEFMKKIDAFMSGMAKTNEEIEPTNVKKISILEEFGQDDIVHALVNMVGPKGKLKHKKFSDFLTDELDVKPDYQIATRYDKKPKELVDALININYHGEAAMLRQLISGNKSALDLTLAINKEHMKIGHLPHWLSVLRNIHTEESDWMLEDIEQAAKGFANDYDTVRYNLSDKKQFPAKFWKMAQKLDKKYYERLLAAKEFRVEPLERYWGIRLKTLDKKDYSTVSMLLGDFARQHSEEGRKLKVIFSQKDMPKKWVKDSNK